ncbi:MAG: phosphoribosylamine--glycine ligase [Verrucomicrobiota bacterium]
MKILVVGKGGREHALITALHESPTETEIYSFPGSDAIFQLAKPVKADGLTSLGTFMREHEIDLCVAGEESYLVKEEGLSAVCEKIGVPCWGPPKEAAQLEASKDFAKQFMVRHGIPTGGYAIVDSFQAAKEAISSYPTVLKFDGLAAGKGVAICEDEASASEFLQRVFINGEFGEGNVLVEEFLQGPEISIFVAVSGSDYQILAPARDYKRIGENDEGPNTGGMGAVSSRSGLIEESLLREIEETVVKPTIDGLESDRLNYCGFLYFGLMLTEAGPKMLEYNCRFGDPEAQAVMPLISGDFCQYVFRAAKGSLEPGLIQFADAWSVCLILASAGYPATSRSGDQISGLDEVLDCRVYHAGTRLNGEGGFETNGGRVLAIVSSGKTREEAVERVYLEADKVEFPGSQRRRDIGRLHFE